MSKCEYCSIRQTKEVPYTYNTPILENGGAEVYIESSWLRMNNQGVMRNTSIKFCPMCGENLYEREMAKIKMQKKLTKKEQECKNYMLKVFVPILHQMVEEINPEKYHAWNGNLCRQTAVFASTFLNGSYPDYEWQAWEGDFEDKVMGEPCRYEHAWIFAKHKESNRRLFLDLSHNVKERLFIVTKVNAYPKDSEEHKDMKCLSRKRLDVPAMMLDKEYNTGLTGGEFMAELTKRLLTKVSIMDIMSIICGIEED